MAKKKSGSKEASEEEAVAIPLRWQDHADLDTIYANQLFISHAGPEFLLVFGRVELPIAGDDPPPDVVHIKPVAKITISPTAMPQIASTLEKNVRRFLERTRADDTEEDPDGNSSS